MSTVARVGVVQWSMENVSTEQAWRQKLDFYIETLADYQCDFILFPEFFGIPLLAQHDQHEPVAAIHALAARTPRLIEHVAAQARRLKTTIIPGSFPLVQEGALVNMAYFCRPDGSVDVQPKIHPTPNERTKWQMQGGNALNVFDTPFGRVAILICYDIEFPELGRVLAEKHVDILFVPSWTDTRHGYYRVRLCAQARAIENECYVVLSGSTGHLTGVVNADIQYTQSAVFTPSDRVFPHDCLLAQADANIPSVIMAELDVAKLGWLRKAGAVRNGQDRRTDLYSVEWRGEDGRGQAVK